MTITLALRGGETAQAKAYLPFEMYGHTFAVHKSHEYINYWNVSEVSKGIAVCYNQGKRQDAIKKAKEILGRVGEKGFKEAFEYAINNPQ